MQGDGRPASKHPWTLEEAWEAYRGWASGDLRSTTVRNGHCVATVARPESPPASRPGLRLLAGGLRWHNTHSISKSKQQKVWVTLRYSPMNNLIRPTARSRSSPYGWTQWITRISRRHRQLKWSICIPQFPEERDRFARGRELHPMVNFLLAILDAGACGGADLELQQPIVRPPKCW